MLNEIIVIGNLTNDGKVFKKNNTNEFLFYTNRIAINEKIKNNKITTFIDIKINNPRLEKIISYLKKGQRVLIKGALREKTSKNGIKFYYINVNKIVILDKNNNTNNDKN